jgi:hypothetical protein
MRTAIAVETTPTEAAPADSSREWLGIQNASDVDMALDLTSSGESELNMSNGIILAAGDSIFLNGEVANNRVMLIHGSTGTKDARVQGGR